MKRKNKTTVKYQKGMELPEGIFCSRPTTLWKMMKVLKDDGPANHVTMAERMKAKWKNYPPPHSLYTLLAKRKDVFILVDTKFKLYDLKEEIRDAMD
tara:strand:+ start:42 stop:332 length:291 start_codon:yes stop_codon:yes gene_type:complete